MSLNYQSSGELVDATANGSQSRRSSAFRRWFARVGIAYLVFCAIKGVLWLAAGAAAFAFLK